MTTATPRVLVVYYTYTQQSLKVAEEIAAVLSGRGCDVRLGGIEFTDSRYAQRFSRSPFVARFSTSWGCCRRKSVGPPARSACPTRHATATTTSSASARRPGG